MRTMLLTAAAVLALGGQAAELHGAHTVATRFAGVCVTITGEAYHPARRVEAGNAVEEPFEAEAALPQGVEGLGFMVKDGLWT